MHARARERGGSPGGVRFSRLQLTLWLRCCLHDRWRPPAGGHPRWRHLPLRHLFPTPPGRPGGAHRRWGGLPVWGRLHPGRPLLHVCRHRRPFCRHLARAGLRGRRHQQRQSQGCRQSCCPSPGAPRLAGQLAGAGHLRGCWRRRQQPPAGGGGVPRRGGVCVAVPVHRRRRCCRADRGVGGAGPRPGGRPGGTWQAVGRGRRADGSGAGGKR